MKSLRFILLIVTICFTLSSCRLWNKLFAPKYGCPTNGKNIGAERLSGGDPKAEREARKAKKFKQGKF